MKLADKLSLSKKARELSEFKKSWIHTAIINEVNRKIEAQVTISTECSETEKIFRSQGAIRALKGVLRIPDELGKK